MMIHTQYSAHETPVDLLTYVLVLGQTRISWHHCNSNAKLTYNFCFDFLVQILVFLCCEYNIEQV